MASEDTPTIMTTASEEASSEVTVVTMGNKKTPNEFEEPSDAYADQSEDTPTIMTSEEASSEVTVVTMGNKKTPNEELTPTSDACADQSEDTLTIMTSEEASSKAMIMTMPMASEKNPTEEPSGAGTDQKKFYQISVNVKVKGKDKIYHVYLDTTTLGLAYQPLVDEAGKPESNYSTIFCIEPAAGGGHTFKNYVIPNPAAHLTSSKKSVKFETNNTAESFSIDPDDISPRHDSTPVAIYISMNQNKYFWVPSKYNRDPKKRVIAVKKVAETVLPSDYCNFYLKVLNWEDIHKPFQ